MTLLGAETRRRAVIVAGVAWILMVIVTIVSACLSGCGGAQQVGAGTACSSLMLLIGERRDYPQERAVADIESVSEVCQRLAATDAGTP